MNKRLDYAYATDLDPLPLCENSEIVHLAILRAVKQFFDAPGDVHLGVDMYFQANNKQKRSTVLANIEFTKPPDYVGVKKSTDRKPRPAPPVIEIESKRKSSLESSTNEVTVRSPPQCLSVHKAVLQELPTGEFYAVRQAPKAADEKCVPPESCSCDPTANDASSLTTNTNSDSDDKRSLRSLSNIVERKVSPKEVATAKQLDDDKKTSPAPSSIDDRKVSPKEVATDTKTISSVSIQTVDAPRLLEGSVAVEPGAKLKTNAVVSVNFKTK